MQMLPYRSWSLQTELTAEQIKSRLQEMVRPRTILPRLGDRHHYVGTVRDNGFAIQPTIAGLSILLPEIHGQFVLRDDHVDVRFESIPSKVTLFAVVLLAAVSVVLVTWSGVLLFAFVTANVIVAWFLMSMGHWLEGGRFQRELERRLSPTNSSKAGAK